jgi:hypothetical protein
MYQHADDSSLQFSADGYHTQVILDRNGNVGIGTTTPNAKLHVAGNGIFDGEVHAPNILATSSREFKKDIAYLSSSDYETVLKKIEKINVAQFRWKEEPKSVEPHIGIIAEEAPKEILSEDGKAVSYSEYLAFLLAAIKAQNEKIQVLERELAELKGSKVY